MTKALEEKQIREALHRLLTSAEWAQSARLGQFLRFVVDETLSGEGARLKETVIGAAVFGRDAGYDPKIDPVVRVEARRLRGKLLEYYAGSGAAEQVRIELPKGTYQPRFECIEATPPRTPRRPIAWWAVAAGVLVVGVAVGLLWRKGAEPKSAEPPRLLTSRQGHARSPVFSPDGTQILFSREDDDFHSRIFVAQAEGGETRACTSGPVRDYFPAWSPDGRRIAFARLRDDERWEVRVRPAGEGGDERVVAQAVERGPLWWTSDGSAILVAHRPAPAAKAAIASVDIETGQIRAFTDPPAGAEDSYPRLSADGRQLAFLRSVEGQPPVLFVRNMANGGARALVQGWARIEGFSWNAAGDALVVSMRRGPGTLSLWRVALAGGEPVRIPEGGPDPLSPAVSPHGTRLAYVTRISDTNLWRAPIDGKGGAEQLTRGVALDTSPQISPDGRRIAWRSGGSGFDEIWVADADGKNARQLTRMRGSTTGSPRWSPDGRKLAFESRTTGQADVYVIDAEVGEPSALTKDPAGDSLPSWSRDGQHLYFASNRTGQWQVWRMNPDGADPQQVTRRGGTAAFEAYDGRTLYYVVPGRDGLWRVPLEGGPETQLTPGPAVHFWGQWAVSEKGLFYAEYRRDGPRRIMRLDLASGKLRDAMPLTRLPVQWDSGMAVTRDERWLVWAQLDQAGSDIYVVDGWK